MASQESNDNTTTQPGSIQLTFIMVGLCLAVFLTGMVRALSKPLHPNHDSQVSMFIVIFVYDPVSILDSGAGDFTAAIPPESRNQALQAYSASLILTLYIPLALSRMSIVGALGTR